MLCVHVLFVVLLRPLSTLRRGQVEEARRTIPELAGNEQSGSDDTTAAAAATAAGDAGAEEFDLWGNLDNLVMEAAASKVQAVARGKIARRKAAERAAAGGDGGGGDATVTGEAQGGDAAAAN